MSNTLESSVGPHQGEASRATSTPSDPITVVASLVIQPGHEVEARTALKRAVEQTRSERGCLRYELFEDLQDPLKMVMLEVWQSREALEAHAQGPAFKTLVAALGDTVLIDVNTLRPVS